MFLNALKFRNIFFQRNNLTYRNASGTSASVVIDRDEVSDYIREQISDYNSYTADRLLNLNESALFYEILGSLTIGTVGEEKHGRGDSKKRVSLCATVFASGDKLPMAFIVTAMQPRDMSSNRQLWQWINKIIMVSIAYSFLITSTVFKVNSDLFKQVLLYIDSHHKVLPNSLIILDIYGAHGMEPEFLESLVKIKVAFLPPNCTSRFQPLDAGLFYAAKCRYRKVYFSEHMKRLEPVALNILTRKSNRRNY